MKPSSLQRDLTENWSRRPRFSGVVARSLIVRPLATRVLALRLAIVLLPLHENELLHHPSSILPQLLARHGQPGRMFDCQLERAFQIKLLLSPTRPSSRYPAAIGIPSSEPQLGPEGLAAASPRVVPDARPFRESRGHGYRPVQLFGIEGFEPPPD